MMPASYSRRFFDAPELSPANYPDLIVFRRFKQGTGDLLSTCLTVNYLRDGEVARGVKPELPKWGLALSAATVPLASPCWTGKVSVSPGVST